MSDLGKWLTQQINSEGVRYRCAAQENDADVQLICEGRFEAYAHVMVHAGLASHDEVNRLVDMAKGGLD